MSSYCTVGIPNCNVSALLSKFLRSIFSVDSTVQRLGVKFLIIDDGSNSTELNKVKDLCSIYDIDQLMNRKRYEVAKSWNVRTKHLMSD